MEVSKFDHYKQLIPSDGCIPLFGLRLIAYYTEEGILSFKLVADQEVKVPLSTVIGIMDMAKTEMILTNTLREARKKMNRDNLDGENF